MAAATFSALEQLQAKQIWMLEVERNHYRDALNSILTTVEDASVPYERLKIAALARAGLDGTPT